MSHNCARRPIRTGRTTQHRTNQPIPELPNLAGSAVRPHHQVLKPDNLVPAILLADSTQQGATATLCLTLCHTSRGHNDKLHAASTANNITRL